MIDILCVGDLDLDLFAAVSELPHPDQKVSGRHLGQRPGGMAANVAVAVARLGGSSRLLAAIGDDEAGAQAVAAVRAEGVDVDFVARRASCRTFTCIVLLSPSGEKALIRLETDAYLPRPSDLAERAFLGVRHVHTTYGDAELAIQALSQARARGLSTSVDLEAPDIWRSPDRLGELLPLVDTLFCNRAGREALVAHLGGGEADLAREVIITQGSNGSLRLADGERRHVPGVAVTPVDTTGAGDCFAGAYLLCRLHGSRPADALAFANMAAALSTLDHGAQTALPSRAIVERHLAGHYLSTPPREDDHA